MTLLAVMSTYFYSTMYFDSVHNFISTIINYFDIENLEKSDAKNYYFFNEMWVSILLK